MTTYQYDALGRQVKVIGPDPATGLNDVTKTAYDADGNVTSTTDPLGHATTNVYNSLNEIVSTTDANGGKTSYTYDADGEQTSVTDPMGGVTSYQYLCLCQLAVADFSALPITRPAKLTQSLQWVVVSRSFCDRRSQGTSRCSFAHRSMAA